MQLSDLKTLMLVIDPNLTKFKGQTTGNYTVWYPGGISGKLMSDDQSEDFIQRAYIDRFTKIDNDPIVKQIKTKLDEAFIPFDYVIDYEQDTGYIHHSFSCYVGSTNESEE